MFEEVGLEVKLLGCGEVEVDGVGGWAEELDDGSVGGEVGLGVGIVGEAVADGVDDFGAEVGLGYGAEGLAQAEETEERPADAGWGLLGFADVAREDGGAVHIAEIEAFLALAAGDGGVGELGVEAEQFAVVRNGRFPPVP